MRIAYDFRRIMNAGIGRYMRGIAKAIAELSPNDQMLLILPRDGEWHLDIPANAEAIYAKAKYYSVAEQWELPKILRSWHADVLHAPHFVVPFMKVCPTAVTVHDVIHLVYPHDISSKFGRYYADFMLRQAVSRSDAVITVTEFSKSEIVRCLGTSAAKIDVAPLGADAALRRVSEEARIRAIREEFNLQGNFILYTGIFRDRKNHQGLFRAFEIVARAIPDCDLVIAGSLGGGAAVIEGEARRAGIEDRIRLTGFIPDEKLAALYSSATVYACPSLYEGFGFTILEAAACGTPVVAHRGSSLTEVGGDGVEFADARNPEEFAAALLRVITRPEVSARLIEKGYENLERFSWRRCGELTYAVYERIAGTQLSAERQVDVGEERYKRPVGGETRI